MLDPILPAMHAFLAQKPISHSISGLPYGAINRSGLDGGVNNPASIHAPLRDQTVDLPF